MKTQNTAKPIVEMTADELTAALETTNAQIEADTLEHAGLQPRMVQAAEQGETDEWQRLHALHATLPTKIAGAQLRALSIRILIKQKNYEAAQAANVASGAPLEKAQAAFEAARKEFDEAMLLSNRASERERNLLFDLKSLKHARADAQAAAAKSFAKIAR